MTRITGISSNVAALLDTIAISEIGSRLMAETDDGYNCLVGSTSNNPKTFTSYDDHPCILNKALDSTAAGRYQIIKGMYDILTKRLGTPDFSPTSQDMMAIELLHERGAINAIESGQIITALRMASPVWASLPYSTASQHKNPISDLILAYQKNGGIMS